MKFCYCFSLGEGDIMGNTMDFVWIGHLARVKDERYVTLKGMKRYSSCPLEMVYKEQPSQNNF